MCEKKGRRDSGQKVKKKMKKEVENKATKNENSWPQYSRYKMENVCMLHTISHKKGGVNVERVRNIPISSAYDTVNM